MNPGFMLDLLAAAALAMTVMAGAQNLPVQPKADVIFLNANIYTGVADSSSLVKARYSTSARKSTESPFTTR